jgi:hypothetical protein
MVSGAGAAESMFWPTESQRVTPRPAIGRDRRSLRWYREFDAPPQPSNSSYQPIYESDGFGERALDPPKLR